MSYVHRRKRGDRVYLEGRESYRGKGKIRNRLVRYLGVEAETPGTPPTLPPPRPSGRFSPRRGGPATLDPGGGSGVRATID